MKKFTEDIKELKKGLEDTPWISVAADQIAKGWRTESPKLLRLRIFKSSIAEMQVDWGWITEDPKLLGIYVEGKPIAHMQYAKGWRTEDPNICKLRDGYSGETLYHIMIQNAWRTDNLDILKIRGGKEYHGLQTILETQLKLGWVTEDLEILKMKLLNRQSVLEFQFENYWVPSEGAQKLKINGTTVGELYFDKILKDL